ncbi:hypothetical protein R3X25_00650 [Lutibacter sp. TH_r2]|uniref:hypothetical protein n=1 Tax=Lutibacter sp. TH_r2 TaxID=3082083 RepID=UPI0029540254|nr:hypothetical protein [Lutibacter sp. TH_r2]MDV7185774.1 hypothetical protein [Lutibacter sp. TH_r2]
MRTPKTIFILLCILLFQSCTEDVDFDQIDDASIQTSYKLSLVYVDFEAPDFLNIQNQEIPYTFDLIQTTVEDSSQDYLEKIEITVITENTFSRPFTCQFLMYNAEGKTIYSLQPEVVIEPNSIENTTILEIPQEDLHFLFEAAAYGFIFELPPSANQINSTTIGTLSFKSSMELFFNFNNQ